MAKNTRRGREAQPSLGLVRSAARRSAPGRWPWALLAAFFSTFAAGPAVALPTGYLVWCKGKLKDSASRKIYRMTLPGKTDVRALTSGEDVEGQISPDGKWVAFAKAKLAGGSDYHNFKLWKIYIVSIHGVGGGRKEIKIDDSGAWPSWGSKGELYYNQPDGTHSTITRVTIDAYGAIKEKKVFFSTRSAFGSYTEVTEAFVSPDAGWFAARTRGTPSVNGVGAYQVSPPQHFMLARAGNIGCMPYVAPDGTFGIIAGAEHGIRWGHAPNVSSRKEDQLLVPARSSSHKAYHPGIATDGKWVLAAQGTEQEHNSGPYDIYIYALDSSKMTVSGEELLAGGDFNGWPHIWVGQPSLPPPPEPQVLELYPSSYTVAPKEQVTLTWTTSEADQVELDGKPVSPDGTQVVQPASTTRYTLVARSTKAAGRTDAETCEVTVNATAQAVAIERFEALPASIEQGESAKLSWKVKNPTTLELDGLRAAPVETREVSPLESTTYVLTAQGHKGPVSRSVTVTVEALGSGLLPDSGGFVCHQHGGPVGHPGGEAMLLWGLALLALCLGRRRRR